MIVYLLVVSLVFELFVYLFPNWSTHRLLTSVSVLAVVTTIIFLIAQIILEPGLGWALLIILQFYRLLNINRILWPRMDKIYLVSRTRRTFIVLIGYQLIVLSGWWLWSYGWTESSHSLLLLTSLQVAAAVTCLLTTLRTISKTVYRPTDQHFSDKELPTVSVAIPARNETTELEQCLQTVVSSDYPKLEVLVLDDCSQDKTAEVIRSFAQNGVRFVPGSPPSQSWLAKNQAYAKLAKEANGQFLLFIGVDVRLGPNTVRSLVTAALTKHKQMISILPMRTHSRPSDAFIQPMRYFWEVALPRRLFNRPATLSTCWLISRQALRAAGGFEAVRSSILPEAFMARSLVATDGYSLMRSGPQLDVQTVKGLSAQYQTALRTNYPLLRRRPENVLVISLAHLVLQVAPLLLAAVGFWFDLGALHILALVTTAALLITYYLIITVTDPTNWWLTPVVFPVGVLTSVLIHHLSMAAYEFGQVVWKGRNVCLPVMHAFPKLPPVPPSRQH